MTIEDYSVSTGEVKVWFTYDDVKYIVILYTANVINIIESVIENKEDWVKR